MKLIKHYDFTKMETLHEDFTVEIGDKWANNEKQAYRDHPDNLYFDEGLVLQATLEDKKIYSSRLKTKGKFEFQYGRVDIQAKLPKGKGTWPALWMMPADNAYGHWPKSGEIDIMEHVGNELDELVLCLHTERYNHTSDTEYMYKEKIENLSDDFQEFSIIWDEESITYLLNNKVKVTYKKGEDNKVSTPDGWPFDQSFFLIMNLAIGGWFGGNVDYSMFPQQFIIKDIKVYQ